MSYKDSDYTVVIALICWLEGMNFCAETHLGDGVLCFCLPVDHHCSSAPLQYLLEVQLSGRLTKILTTLPWLPSCTDTCQTHPGGEVVNTAIIFFLFLATIAHLIQTEWSSCALNWTRCRIAAYILWAAFEQGLNTVCPGIHKVRV